MSDTITIGMLDQCPLTGCEREGQTHEHRRSDLPAHPPVAPAPTLAEQVGAMSRAELARASEKFRPLNSTHEGWAVILEELDEASEEINRTHAAHATLWGDVRADDDGRASAEALTFYAERAVVELIQVAAMGRRYIRDLTPADEPGPRTDASGPDMWPDDQPTSADVPIRSSARGDWNESRGEDGRR